MKEMVKAIRPYITIAIFVLLLIAAFYVLFTSSAGDWRYMYCSANEAHAIECTAKGWW